MGFGTEVIRIFELILRFNSRPEDNDDIVEMIDSEDPYLRKEHGDFYIAEHLLAMEGTKGTEKIIIAEVGCHPVTVFPIQK